MNEFEHRFNQVARYREEDEDDDEVKMKMKNVKKFKVEEKFNIKS